MKRVFAANILFFMLSALSLSAQSLNERIDSLLDSEAMRKATTGIVVYDLTDSVELYSNGADKLLRPASILKLLTSITAADYIGGDSDCFVTGAYMTGNLKNGTLTGDIYIKGGFDPEFMDKDMNALVDGIVASGIKKVKGSLIGDVSMADTTVWGEGWCWDDAPSSFQPYMSALTYEKGRVKVNVPPKGSGKNISVFPESTFYTLKDMRSVAPYNNKRPGATRNWMENDNTIIVQGNVKYTYTKELSMYRSQDFFMHTLKDRLAANGIEFSTYSFGELPSDVVEICSVTHKLQDALKEAMKESDNLSADAILFQLGKEYNTKYVDRDDCLKIVKRKMRELGVNPAGFKLVDGCGISLYNYVSANLMMEFLKYSYYNKEVNKYIYPYLPVCSHDGTLKHRMYRTPAQGRVRAKTGTVTGVSSLAGYVESKKGKTIAFVIISNGVVPIRRGHQFQDEVCSLLAEYPFDESCINGK